MGMSAKLADSEGEGELLFDMTKGRVQHTSIKTEMPMTMSMAGPDGAPIHAQSLVRNTITMEIVDK